MLINSWMYWTKIIFTVQLLDIFTLNHQSEGSILWGPWSCRAELRSLGTHAPMTARWTPLFMQPTVIIHHYSCPYPQSQSISTSSPSGHKHQLLTLCACSPTRPIIHLLFTRTPPRPLVLTLVHEWVSHKRLENPSTQDSRCDTGHGTSSALHERDPDLLNYWNRTWHGPAVLTCPAARDM